MSDTSFEPAGLEGLHAQTSEAAAAMLALKEPAEEAARSIEDAFTRAGEGMARSLTRAALDGKLTLQDLAAAVLAAVNAAAAASGGGKGLGETIAQVVSAAFSGARADGGPVVAGGGYLVGERGPEVFRPFASGEVQPLGGGVTVNLSLPRESAPGLLRSEAQIAGMLARAVALGARRF
ncbi:MAG TPA: phage tail tape measure C-terminal domain-containing protein [Caulobacteraceae bacterium]|jgi:phage-related minor tail protein